MRGRQESGEKKKQQGKERIKCRRVWNGRERREGKRGKEGGEESMRTQGEGKWKEVKKG